MNRASRLFVRKLLPVALVVWCGTASAAPISYQESVGGDLNGFGPFTIFTLDAGTNTISGRFGETPTGGFDWDSFAFSVGEGTVLDSVAVTLSDFNGNPIQMFWGMFTGTAYNTGTPLGTLSPESPGISSIAGPFGAGLYNVSVQSFVSGGAENAVADYTFSLVARSTSQVPEPSTLALLGVAGLVGCIYRRATRRRSLA